MLSNKITSQVLLHCYSFNFHEFPMSTKLLNFAHDRWQPQLLETDLSFFAGGNYTVIENVNEVTFVFLCFASVC